MIPVDLGGIVCNYDRIYEAVENKRHLFKPANDIQRAVGRVAVVADCAHALGASWLGKWAGEIAVFFFLFPRSEKFDNGRRWSCYLEKHSRDR